MEKTTWEVWSTWDENI